MREGKRGRSEGGRREVGDVARVGWEEGGGRKG